MGADWTWLKNRLVSAKTKANSFWIPSLSPGMMDVGELFKCASNIYDHSMNGIISFLNSNDAIEIDLTRLSEVSASESSRRFGTDEDLFKYFQNEFSRLFKLQRKQAREMGDSSLFIGLPLIEGINEFGDYYRAPLLYVQVELESTTRFQKIRLSIKNKEFILNPTIIGVEVNKRGILFESRYDQETLNVAEALATFKELNINFKMPLTNEVIPFIKKGKSDLGEATKGLSTNSVVNNILLGLFDVKGDKLFQDFTTIMGRDPEAINEIFANKRDLIFNHKQFNAQYDISQIFLVSDIDIYQQLAVRHAMDGDVVIEGPPGTGKSETILNILANIVLRNKTALFVSEKATALDVVYNRLGNLKNVALRVPNITEDKKEFYGQFADFEAFFEKHFAKKLINCPQPQFDPAFVNNAYLDCVRIADVYDTPISSGNGRWLFRDILVNWVPRDISGIHLDDPARFDAHLDSDYAHAWLARHAKAQKLAEEISKTWGMDTFNLLYNEIRSGLRSTKQMLYALSLHQKRKQIKFPSVIGPLFHPNSELQKAYELLTEHVAQWTKYAPYLDSQKAQSLSWIITNDVARHRDAYFFAWFMAHYGQHYLTQIDKTNRKVDIFNAEYPRMVSTYIEQCRLALKATAITNFYACYNQNKNALLEICRQGRSSSWREISWWFNNYRETLFALYPIHMMSFEAASTLLENKKAMYDYVIVDEASQVFLERALPALYRGAKYVVAGDTRQLRPSAFFQSRANYDDDVFDEAGSVNAVEIDEAVNATSLIHFLKERARISTTLRFHYRSDFASLIAFTNNHIYGDKLIFLDRATPATQTFISHLVVNGKWQANKNVEEAQAVVKRIQDLCLSTDYDKTLGVITFNKTQADLIEALLDQLNDARINEWRERTGRDGEYTGLFIKNIENVQGDERDIILFSLGYDKTVTNYGPISKNDGEHRLNVAITRAKQRIELFKTNRASEYNGWSSRFAGTRLLVEYLAYCEQQSQNQGQGLVSQTQTSTKPILDNVISDHRNVLDDAANQFAQVFNAWYTIKPGVLAGSYAFDFVFERQNTPVLAISFFDPRYDDRFAFYTDYVYRNDFVAKRGWNHLWIALNEWFMRPQDVLLRIQKVLVKNSH